MEDSRGLIVVVFLLAVLVIAGPCKQTVPDVPTPPVPATGLAARVRQLVQQHVPAADRGRAKALASEYRRLAAEIEAATDPLSESPLTTPAAAIAASNGAARQTLGGSWPSWTAFYAALYRELNAAAQGPDSDRTVFGVGRTFGLIAEGLDSV